MSLEVVQPAQPSLAWRLASTATLGGTGHLCKSFLFALNRVQVHGLDGFLELLDERKDIQARERGLITGELSTTTDGGRDAMLLMGCAVSNHISVYVRTNERSYGLSTCGPDLTRHSTRQI